MKYTSKGAALLKQVLSTKGTTVNWDEIAPPLKPRQILDIHYQPDTFVMRDDDEFAPTRDE